MACLWLLCPTLDKHGCQANLCLLPSLLHPAHTCRTQFIIRVKCQLAWNLPCWRGQLKGESSGCLEWSCCLNKEWILVVLPQSHSGGYCLSIFAWSKRQVLVGLCNWTILFRCEKSYSYSVCFGVHRWFVCFIELILVYIYLCILVDIEKHGKIIFDSNWIL